MKNITLHIPKIKEKFIISNKIKNNGSVASWELLFIVSLFSVIAQILLPYLKVYPLLPYNQLVFLFGIFNCCALVLLYIFTQKLDALFVKKSKFTATLMISMALVVAVSTFIPPQNAASFFFGSDIIHSFLFAALCGSLSAGMIISIWQERKMLNHVHVASIAIIHLGTVVFIVGTAITSSFGVDGMLNMHIGQTASEFNLMQNNTTTISTRSLPQKMKLTDFITEYYTDQYNLRVFQFDNGGYDLVESLNTEKGSKHAVNGSEIEILNFYPEFSVEYKILEQPVDTSHTTAALMIDIDNGEEKQSGWVFATDNKNGWLEGNGILGLLTKETIKNGLDSLRTFNSSETSPRPTNSFVVSAKEKVYAVIKENEKVPQILPIEGFPLHIQLAGYQLTIERLLENSRVETIYKTLSDSLINPVLEINVTNNKNTAPYLLSAFDPQPVALGGDKYLLYEKTEPQPKLFKSTVEIFPSGANDKPTVHELTVNNPISMGNYKIYQADFRKNDPTFSGFTVSYDPGKKVVMSGLALMVLGAFAYFIKLTINKRKTT